MVAGDQVLVFDAGPGSTHKLELIMDASSVDALFLTHYHSDHIGDMGELMLKRWATSGSAEPLPIYGPPGIEEVVAGFEAAYQLIKVIGLLTTAKKPCRLQDLAARSICSIWDPI